MPATTSKEISIAEAERAATAQALLTCAQEFWYSERGAGAQGAVKWLTGDDGSLVIYTRGEYRDTLMRNIGEVGNKEHFFSKEHPMTEATATKPAAPVPTKPAAQSEPTWTADDSEKLGEMLAKRNAFLTSPRKHITVGDLRTRIGGMPADAHIMYEDWSDGGGVYVTEVTVGKNLLLLL